MPLVTVIIPTYNHVDTIRYSIKSVQEQTFKDIEIFVVGDGAPSRTDAIMDELSKKDSRIRYFPNPKGEGHGEIHRAKALEHAQGKFIFYCGDDDLWLKHHIEELIPFLEDASFVNTHQANVCPKGTVTVLSESFTSSIAQLRMQKSIWNICGPTSVAHTMEAYKKLPSGWQPRPKEVPSDLYMWRQWLNQPWCKFYTHSAVTTLHFASPQRKEHCIERRVAELKEWWVRISQPDFIKWLENQWRIDWQKRCERIDFFVQLGQTLFKHKEYSLAEEAFLKAYEMENQGGFCSILSNISLLQNKQQEALKFAQQAYKLDGHTALSYKLLGKVLFKLQHYQKAIDSFICSMELEENPKIYRSISKCYTQLNDHKQAKEFLKKFKAAKKNSKKDKT